MDAMEEKHGLEILKDRLDNPYTDDSHRLDILILLKKFLDYLKKGKGDLMELFSEMRVLLKYEE